MLTVEVRVGLTEGALTTVAGVFGGAVVVVMVVLSVDLAVTEGEDILGAEKLVRITGVVLVEARVESGVETELTLTE